MKRFLTLTAAILASATVTTTAFAHAFLEKAVPGVGASVSGSPNELELSFTQNIVPAFSGVTIAAVDGGAVPAGKATVDPSSPNALYVKLAHPLKPGTYVVSWHVVSVDTHPSSGTYQFTVSP